MQVNLKVMQNVTFQWLSPLTKINKNISREKYCEIQKFLKSMRITFGFLCDEFIRIEVVINLEKWDVIYFGHVVFPHFDLNPFGLIDVSVKIDGRLIKKTQKYANGIQEFG